MSADTEKLIVELRAALTHIPSDIWTTDELIELCSPDNIRALLDRIATLEKALAEAREAPSYRDIQMIVNNAVSWMQKAGESHAMLARRTSEDLRRFRAASLSSSKRDGMTAMQWFRDNYGVPAKRGGRIEYTPCEGSKDASGRLGTITGTQGPHLLVRLDGDRHARPYHPTWQLRYLDATADIGDGTE